MSDRAKPSNQVLKTGSGSTYHGSSKKHSIVRLRPGSMSPGGVGVDIKHNSYERRLNKLKGKTSLKRGIIPPNYGSPIPFNRAYPVYGGKVIKTALVNGCNCPDNSNGDQIIYGSSFNSIQDKILSIGYKFNVGDFVWAKKHTSDTKLYKAQINSIENGLYTIQFSDDRSIGITNVYGLLIYYECNCLGEQSVEEQILVNSFSAGNSSSFYKAYAQLACNLLNVSQEN
jgi:hypothetical protein